MLVVDFVLAKDSIAHEKQTIYVSENVKSLLHNRRGLMGIVFSQ